MRETPYSTLFKRPGSKLDSRSGFNSWLSLAIGHSLQLLAQAHRFRYLSSPLHSTFAPPAPHFLQALRRAGIDNPWRDLPPEGEVDDYKT